MAKLKNVTNEELKAVVESFDGPMFEAQDLANRIEKGYCDDLEKIIDSVRALNAVIRMSASLSAALIMKMALQDQKRELETLFKERMTSGDR